MELNVEFVREKLIPALRSGEYQQGTGQLRNKDDEFCCLGVACDIIIKEKMMEGVEWVRQIIEHDEDGDPVYGDWKVRIASTMHEEGEGLPSPIQNLLGIRYLGDFDRRNMEVPTSRGREVRYVDSLATLNDDTELGFEGVADFLEKLVREQERKLAAQNT